MRFIRVSWLDELGWGEVVRLLQSPALIEAQLNQVERHDDTVQRRIRLEQFRRRQAEARITRIQEDQLADTSLLTRQEAASKIEELRKVIEKADGEIARLQSIAQLEKQGEETVEATRKAIERLRDTNLKTASFDEKAELVAKLGIKVYPSEDLTYIRIFCGLNVTEPRKVSCHKTSIASPKL